jgi:GWxTD domain-containing protein
LLLALAGCAGSGTGSVSRDAIGTSPDAYITTRADTTGRLVPVVRVEIPYRSLVFLRDGEGYAADLRVEVTAWREGRQAGGGVGSGRARVTGYPATRTQERLYVDVPLVVRGEGPVQLEVASVVPRTARRWRQQLELSPRAVAMMPVAILAVEVQPAAGGDGAHVVTAGDDSVTVAVHLRASGATWTAAGVRVILILDGAGRAQPERLAVSVAPPETENDAHFGDSTIRQRWPAAWFPFGRTALTVELEAREGDRVERLPFGPRRELLVLRVPLQDDRAWRQHVGWLDGLLPGTAIDSLRALDADHRLAAWADVWTQVGAATGDEPLLAQTSHLRRVADADDRFGQFGRGALSDRGRALIRYGEPQSVEQTLDDLSRTGVWEIWLYPSRNLRLVFYDANAINDFRLVEVRQD